MRRNRVFISLFIVLILAVGFVAGRASADQPHMQSALDHLHAAKTELELADRDKAGHRESAVGFVDKAIRQVELGIAAGRR
jgi:hypothetical protein